MSQDPSSRRPFAEGASGETVFSAVDRVRAKVRGLRAELRETSAAELVEYMVGTRMLGAKGVFPFHVTRPGTDPRPWLEAGRALHDNGFMSTDGLYYFLYATLEAAEGWDWHAVPEQKGYWTALESLRAPDPAAPPAGGPAKETVAGLIEQWHGAMIRTRAATLRRHGFSGIAEHLERNPVEWMERLGEGCDEWNLRKPWNQPPPQDDETTRALRSLGVEPSDTEPSTFEPPAPWEPPSSDDSAFRSLLAEWTTLSPRETLTRLVSGSLPIPLEPHLLLRLLGPSTRDEGDEWFAAACALRDQKLMNDDELAHLAKLILEGVCDLFAGHSEWDRLDEMITAFLEWENDQEYAPPSQLGELFDLFIEDSERLERELTSGYLAAMGCADLAAWRLDDDEWWRRVARGCRRCRRKAAGRV